MRCTSWKQKCIYALTLALVGCCCYLATEPLSNASTTKALHPPMPESAAPLPTDDEQETVILAFFGLVKNVDPEQLRTMQLAVVQPLLAAGYKVKGFLHTHQMSVYENVRNKEGAHAFNQTESIALLRTLLPNLVVSVEDPSRTDDYFNASRKEMMLRYGNAFDFSSKPNESFHYWCRQLFSLLRVTEMWSGMDLLLDGGAQRNGSKSLNVNLVRGVIYLRPDVYYFSQLNVDAFESVTLRGKESMSRRNAARNHSLLSSGDVLSLHPWLTACSQHGLADGPQPLHQTAAMRESIRGLLKAPLHIGIPLFEHGGISDRFAFGSPDVMLAYGMRLLGVPYAVELYKQALHPETYLHRYLCESAVHVHIAPVFFARKRSHGGLSEVGAIGQRSYLFHHRVPMWLRSVEKGPVEPYGYGTQVRCLFESFWLPHPFPIEKRRNHSTALP